VRIQQSNSILKLTSLFPVHLVGVATNYLGIHIHWTDEPDGHLSAHLSQSAFINDLAEHHQLATSNPVLTPYRSGSHVDTITGDSSDSITSTYQSIVGAISWLVSNTRPDVATIHCLLVQWSHRPTTGHLAPARHVMQYLQGTSTRGVSFASRPSHISGNYNKYPITHPDANWGPKDASQPNPKDTASPPPELPLFASRSISVFMTFIAGVPIHWKSNRQSITAQSSAEAEIYATREATKFLLGLALSMHNTALHDVLFPPGCPTTVFNDNRSCVDWSNGTTTK
jgi:hypothetical protein